jgi:hypothetical protein
VRVTVYRNTVRVPGKHPTGQFAFTKGRQGYTVVGTIRAPDGSNVAARNGGAMKLRVPLGVSGKRELELEAGEAIEEAKKGNFRLAWEPAGEAVSP